MVELVNYARLAKRFESAMWRGSENYKNPIDY